MREEMSESEFLADKSRELKKLITGVKTLKDNVSIERLLSCTVSYEIGIKWEHQLNRWGSTFVSSVLAEPIIPDYFLYHGNENIGDQTIESLWLENIAPSLTKLRRSYFNTIHNSLKPGLSLLVLKSSMLSNARLARYCISDKVLKNMAQTDFIDTETMTMEEMFSSRYWELRESVNGHLFGRQNFFSERSAFPDFSKLLIIVTDDEKLSLGYINFIKDGGKKICYVNKKIAVLFGSESFSGENNANLITIKKMIHELCSISIFDLFKDSKNVAPEDVLLRIIQIAPDIAVEIRNTCDFEKIRDQVIDEAFAELLMADKKVVSCIHELFAFLLPKEANTSIIEKIRILIISFFDLFMFAPMFRNYLFNYANYSADMGMTWVIMGDEPVKKNGHKNLKNINLERIDSTFSALYNQILRNKDNNKILYRDKPTRSIKEKCPRLTEALSRSKTNLPVEIKEILTNGISLPDADESKRMDEDACKGLYALCLILEISSYLTGEAHENSPLTFTFLISSSHAWSAFADVISDGELFEPNGIREENWAEETSKLIKSNYSILQIPRVVAFFDRLKVWDNNRLKRGQIGKVSESERNKGLIGYPFFYHSLWKNTKTWAHGDFIIEVQGTRITVLRGINNDHSVRPFIEWDTKKNKLYNLEQKELAMQQYIEKFCCSDVQKKLIVDVLTTIATTPGEGTLIVFHNEKDDADVNYKKLRKCFADMDHKDWMQLWRKNKKLLRFERDTLRAALRMDGGARMIRKNNGNNGEYITNIELRVRQSIRPSEGHQLDMEKLIALVGKGSRHHSAAAISTHFIDEWQQKEPEKGAVVVVSADGPIMLLPLSGWVDK